MAPQASVPTMASWYGKLPTAGDFVSRRLSGAFIEAWDGWLTAGLLAWRQAEPQWLPAYLAAPSWRFLLASRSVYRHSPWLAGVLMPSVDKVGRYFPLTLVQPLDAPPQDEHAAQALLSWLHRLNDLALDALHDDWSVETLESALVTLGLVDARQAPRDTASLAPCAPLCAPLVGHAAAGRSLWWSADDQGETRALATRQLPRDAHFAALLAGRWPVLHASRDFMPVNPNPSTKGPT